MSLIETKYFGAIEHDEESAFHFPLGLPVFEGENSFVPIELPGSEPLVFLQSTSTRDLCFLAFPILVVSPDYHLGVAPEDLATLGLEGDGQPRIGQDVLVLSLLCVRDKFPVTANLMAPVVVNLRTREAVQAVRHDSVYSHEQPVAGAGRAEAC
jgi:flagellar assembly factor FliW